MEIKIDENKYETVGYEYMYIENPLVSGPLTGYGTIKDILAFLVADNEAATSAKAYVYDETGRGYELVFYQDELTQGYYSTPFGGQDHYSVVNMKLDLNPVQVNIVPREVQ